MNTNLIFSLGASSLVIAALTGALTACDSTRETGGAAVTNPAIEGAAIASNSTGATAFFVHAHQDDWQLFMGPYAVGDIEGGAKVVFVYTTAGVPESGVYGSARERAARESVFVLAPGFTETCASTTVATHSIWRCSYGNTVSYFLRLPNATPYSGCADATAGCLEELRDSGQPLSAIDGSTTYATWADFAGTLGSIISVESVGATTVAVNAPDPNRTLNPADHEDHYATGDAIASIAGSSPWSPVWFAGYETMKWKNNHSFD